jgi:cytochrome c oxidase cbb3-type subunit 1
MHPYYVIRATGGILYLTGALIMVYNLWKTATGAEPRLAARPALSPQAAE